MISLRNLIAMALSTAMCLSVVSCGGQTSGGNKNETSGDSTNEKTAQNNVKVGILKWVTHDALDNAENGFIDALKDGGYIEGENLTLDRQNANGDVTVANTIATKLVNNNSDLVLAIATPAAQSMQSKTTTIPILGTAVTDYVEAKLVDTNEIPGGNISGTSDMTSIDAQIDLLLEVLPEIKALGILYNSSEINSQIQADVAKKYAESKGLTVVVKTVSNVNDIQQTATSLAEQVDAFWLPTDNILASAMGILGNIAEQKSIPIVPAESGMVEAGGAFTLGIDYYKLGYETGQMAVEILKDGADTATMPIRHQTDTVLTINQEMIDKLGITIPADMLDQVA